MLIVNSTLRSWCQVVMVEILIGEARDAEIELQA